MSDVQRLLTVPELAGLARQSRRTIDRRIAAGDIKVVRLGPRTPRITREEAARYLSGLTADTNGSRLEPENVHRLPGGSA